jgi:hypothetical protein
MTRILILEDDLKTLACLFEEIYLLEEKHQKFLSVTVLSEYTQVLEYINRLKGDYFDVILLDRDCKADGSFHILDIDKFGADKIIGISSIPSYNAELEEKGVHTIVWKDYKQLKSFASEVAGKIENIIF